MNSIYGMNLVFNPLAIDIRTTWKVEPTAIKKRRRGWRVVKHVVEKPGCYIMGDTVVLHPDLKHLLKGTS